MLRSRLLVLSFLALGSYACSAILGDFTVASNGGGGPGGDDGGNDGGGGPLGLVPTEARIGLLHSQTFTATGDVTWSVQEGDAAGTVDAAGKFIATDKAGVAHVVATSKADPSITSVATVTVVPLGINALVGVNGGSGNIDGPPLRAHFNNPGGIGFFGNGRQIYVIADSSNQTIRKYDEAVGKTVTLAGLAGTKGSANGPAATARFNNPRDIAVDENGDKIFVMDADNHCIRKVNLQTGDTDTVAGQCGTVGYVDGATGGATRFARMQRMILAPAKDALYVCQQEEGAESMFRGIRRVELPLGKTTSILSGMNSCDIAADNFGGGGGAKIYFTNGSDGQIKSFTDGPTVNPATTNAVALPSGQVFTSQLTIMTGFGGENDLFYVPSNIDNVINHWTLGTGAVDATPYFGVADDEHIVDGNQMTARIGSPRCLTGAPPQAKAFMCERNAIRTIDLNPTPKTLTTKIGAAGLPDRVDGPRNNARFSAPFSVAVDEAGIYYVADVGFEQVLNNTIRKFDPTTGTVSTLAGVPHKNDPPMDGPHDQAKFANPFDMVYVAGKLFVVDILASALRQVDTATGEVKTIAGELGVSGNSNGVGAQAHFEFVDMGGGGGAGGGIATDGTNLYLSDSGNFSIRKVVIATGEVSTLAGGTKGSANGTGMAAQFQSPYGLAYDDGFVYVADGSDDTIRKVDVKTGEVSAFMGLSMTPGAVDGDASTATFTGPIRIAADHLGNLYVVELPLTGSGDTSQFFGTIRRIDIKKRTSFPFAGQRGLNGLGSGTLPSTMNCPLSMALTPKGDLAFVDYCDLEIGAIQPL